MTIKLESGREINPNGGFIGLNEKMKVCEGYDGGLQDDYEGSENPWTDREKQELADIMIARWQEYRPL